MAARKNFKRAELHRAWQDDWDQDHRIKRQDTVKLKQDLAHWNLVKDIEAINAYDALKKKLEYGMYRYNTSLGRNLDVFV